MTPQTPILSARRTDSLEALLQKLWTLRPEIKEKQAITVTLAVAALIREVERTDRTGPSTDNAVSTVAAESADTTTAPEPGARPADVSDDVEWD